MTHNSIDIRENISEPIRTIADEIGFQFSGKHSIELPSILYEPPPYGSSIKNVDKLV